MVMNKTIKIDNDTLNSLNILKYDYEDRFPDREITNDFVVSKLISEHKQNTDPLIKEQREQELLDGYIPLNDFNSLQSSYKELEEKHNSLVKEFENRSNEFNEYQNKKQQLKDKLSQLEETIESLKISLSEKENEISELEKSKSKLGVTLLENNEKIEALEKLNKDLQKRFTEYRQNCFSKHSLLDLYKICCYLKKHKKYIFTAEDLFSRLNEHSLITDISHENILSALDLVGYQVIPIIRYKSNTDDSLAFGFDKKYLKW